MASQDPAVIDAIVPVGATNPHALETRDFATSGQIAPTNEVRKATTNSPESIPRALHLIERFCSDREEEIKHWLNAFEKYGEEHHGNIDEHKTLENLNTLLDRVKRGEFIMTFEEEIDSKFVPAKVVVLKEGENVLERSKRPNPLLWSPFIRILRTKHHYSSPRTDGASGHLVRWLIDDIADFYAKKHSDQEAQADSETWTKSMRKDFSRHLNIGIRFVHHFRPTPASLRIRWNLIVASEKVRCGEVLPDAKDFFAGEHLVASPQNVDINDPIFVRSSSQSNSLARISLRTASRIGYSGACAEEHGGGLFYGPRRLPLSRF
ncbi:hypothetical protein JCM16303_005388 [Sporobolomyces ruberrimus]